TSPDTDKRFKVSCQLGPDGLTVRLDKGNSTGTWRCSGPDALFANFEADVTVTLDQQDTCGAAWFRFQGRDRGYVVKFCTDQVELGTHSGPLFTYLAGTQDGSVSYAVGVPHRFAIYTDQHSVTVSECDPEPADGCANPRLLFTKDP